MRFARDPGIREESLRIYANGHQDCLLILRGVGVLGGAEDLRTEETRRIGKPRARIVIAPKIDSLAEQFPEPAGKKNILLVHMHEDGVVVISQFPDKRKK